MSRIDFTQPHLDIAVVERGDETENFTPIGDLSTILFELGIVLRYRFPKISKGTFEIVVGDKELFFHIALLYPMYPASRAKITNLRITSCPHKSIRGSGWLYPASCAIRTARLNGTSAPTTLKI